MQVRFILHTEYNKQYTPNYRLNMLNYVKFAYN